MFAAIQVAVIQVGQRSYIYVSIGGPIWPIDGRQSTPAHACPSLPSCSALSLSPLATQSVSHLVSFVNWLSH